MASNRQNHHHTLYGRPLKPPLASTRTGPGIGVGIGAGIGTGNGNGTGIAKTPIAPRLATNTHASTHTNTHTNTYTNTSANPSLYGASLPRLAAPKAASLAPSNQPPPSLQPSLVDDTDTPSKPLLTPNVTPRSSSRKSRADSTNSTPAAAADDTPSHLRPKLLPPSNHSDTFIARSSFDDHRPHLTLAKPRSTLSAKDSTRPHATVRSVVNSAASNHGPPRITKQTSPMFFRANEAKPSHPHPPPLPSSDSQKRPTLSKKASSFFYVNARHDENKQQAVSRGTSPALSATSDLHSPHLPLPPASSDSPLSAPLLSPPLSSISSRSPYFHTPSTTSPSLRPPSPPKDTTHLPHQKRSPHLAAHPAPSLPPSTLANHTSLHHLKTGFGKVRLRDGHAKSSSTSSVDTGSPDEARRRSHTTTETPPPMAVQAHADPEQHPSSPAAATTESGRPLLLTPDSRGLLPPLEEPLQSPSQTGPLDLAAEARRDRKILDLEISNSSLLAINKSLEREIRKQKAELKRFRRLSRAGQFNIPATRRTSIPHLEALEETHSLPELDDDDATRPSSPFVSDPAEDFSDDDDDDDDDEDSGSVSSSAHPLSPGTQAHKDAKQRAQDEERLRQDLSRHRELLLDTQRMNKSLQRCLTWTEDLIKHGRKALDYQVPSADVKLGGRILLADDDMDDQQSVQETEDDVSTQAETLDYESDMGGVGPPPSDHSSRPSSSREDSNAAFGGFLDTRPRTPHTPHRPLQSAHAVEFGKPTPLRNPLVMSRENPGNSHSSIPAVPSGLDAPRHGVGETF